MFEIMKQMRKTCISRFSAMLDLVWFETQMHVEWFLISKTSNSLS